MLDMWFSVAEPVIFFPGVVTQRLRQVTGKFMEHSFWPIELGYFRSPSTDRAGSRGSCFPPEATTSGTMGSVRSRGERGGFPRIAARSRVRREHREQRGCGWARRLHHEAQAEDSLHDQN
jgi:hypothetical protein